MITVCAASTLSGGPGHTVFCGVVNGPPPGQRRPETLDLLACFDAAPDSSEDFSPIDSRTVARFHRRLGVACRFSTCPPNELFGSQRRYRIQPDARRAGIQIATSAAANRA